MSRVYGPLGVKSPAQSFNPPILSAFGGEDFSTYGLDLAEVDGLDEQGGEDVHGQATYRYSPSLREVGR